MQERFLGLHSETAEKSELMSEPSLARLLGNKVGKMNSWLAGLRCPTLIPSHRVLAFETSREIGLTDRRL